MSREFGLPVRFAKIQKFKLQGYSDSDWAWSDDDMTKHFKLLF